MFKKTILEAGLEIILKKLQLIPKDVCHYGYNGKSIGIHVSDYKDNDIWLKLVMRKARYGKNTIPDGYRWQGKKISNGCIIVRHSMVYYTTYPFLNGQIYSSEPFLKADITIPENWFDELADALESLQQIKTLRNTTSFIDSKIIQKIFGVTKRMPVVFLVTTHGDLHWANITKAPLKILDWETCGLGPQALDLSMLYTTALDNNNVIKEMDSRFASQLESPAGLWCQLYAISQSIDRYAEIKKHTKQVEKLKRHGFKLIRVLK